MTAFPKFLVIRFAPGSGGNFLSSLLQCSNNVGHWNKSLEYDKPNSNWVTWFDLCFSKNLNNWLEHEPIANHDLGIREIFSAWYDRGNNLSPTDFFNLEKKFCTPYYHYLKNKDSFIPIFWHKNYFPSYFKHSVFVDIMLDQLSIKWFDRSWYYKHHDVKVDRLSKKYLVTRRRHRSSIQPVDSNFSNDYQTSYDSFRSLIKQEVYGNIWRSKYLDENFLKSSSENCPRYVLKLSNLLELDQCYQQYVKICSFLKVNILDYSLFNQLFLIWRNRHAY